MTWEKTLTLLRVAIETNAFPKLHHIRDKAISELEKADSGDFHFADEQQEEE